MYIPYIPYIPTGNVIIPGGIPGKNMFPYGKSLPFPYGIISRKGTHGDMAGYDWMVPTSVDPHICILSIP